MTHQGVRGSAHPVLCGGWSGGGLHWTGRVSGGFRLSPAFPHPGRMKSVPPEGEPGAWIRNFLGGALRTVVCKLQNKNVLPRLAGKLCWNGSPGSPSPRRRRAWGFWVPGALALMFGLKDAGDLQERDPDSPFYDSQPLPSSHRFCWKRSVQMNV